MGALTFIGLAALGLAIGAVGTLLGAGGGFILVPVLLFLYPNESPQVLTSISLAVVFLNAVSGAAGYLRQRRVDLKSGWLFAAGTVPGGLAGVGVNYLMGRASFDGAFAVFLGGVGVWLLLSGAREREHQRLRPDVQRTFEDAQGRRFTYAFNGKFAWVFSFLVGFVANLLGVGGGTLHVAGMVGLLGIPTHVATATSQFVLMLTAASGTAVHLAAGSLADGWVRTVALGLGVVVGAQVAAHLAHRVSGAWILRLLGLAMVGVGIRLAVTTWF